MANGTWRDQQSQLHRIDSNWEASNAELRKYPQTSDARAVREHLRLQMHF